MDEIRFRLPSEQLNQLNNYYLDNFGYDIQTQLLNILSTELEKCTDYSSEQPPAHPIPMFRDSRNDQYKLLIKYPDKTTLQVSDKDYDLLCDIWNEWSKYSFEKDCKNKALMKYAPEKIPCVNYEKRRGYYEIIKTVGNQGLTFGRYESLENAVKVMEFLDKHNWDMKYHSSNLRDIEGCTLRNYSGYLLKIAEGEIEI